MTGRQILWFSQLEVTIKMASQEDLGQESCHVVWGRGHDQVGETEVRRFSILLHTVNLYL